MGIAVPMGNAGFISSTVFTNVQKEFRPLSGPCLLSGEAPIMQATVWGHGRLETLGIR